MFCTVTHSAEILSLEDWQDKRDIGLKQLDAIVPDSMTVNSLTTVLLFEAQDKRMEYYEEDMNRTSLHSAQSATKPTSVLLLAGAIESGKVSTSDKVEKHIPEISLGYLPPTHSLLITRREFAQQLRPAGENGSNEISSVEMYYATINTDAAGWVLERATGKPLALKVRKLMHKIGGENTVYMTTDHVGQPMIGAGSDIVVAAFGGITGPDPIKYSYFEKVLAAILRININSIRGTSIEY